MSSKMFFNIISINFIVYLFHVGYVQNPSAAYLINRVKDEAKFPEKMTCKLQCNIAACKLQCEGKIELGHLKMGTAVFHLQRQGGER